MYKEDNYKYIKMDIMEDLDYLIRKVDIKQDYDSDINYGNRMNDSLLNISEINFLDMLFSSKKNKMYSTIYEDNVNLLQDILRIIDLRKVYKEDDKFYISNIKKENTIQYQKRENSWLDDSSVDELMFNNSEFPIYEDNRDYINYDIIGWMKIDNIEETKNKYYDLNIPEGNLYIANNIVSHNSGKTYTANKVIEYLDLEEEDVAFVAFTGMAAGVMTRKGQVATTIHRLIYNPIVEKGKVRFVKKESLDLKLIVIDEISMVSNKLLEDIQSFNIPIMTLGDPAQLDPVGGSTNNLLDNPDIFLDEPVRQSLENPIIHLANEVRKGNDISLGKYADNVLILRPDQIDDTFLQYADQILVSYNKSAKSINDRFRKDILNIDSEFPIEGDKIMCLQNNWKKMITEDNIDQYLTNRLIGYVDKIRKNMGKIKSTKIDFRPEYFEDQYFDNILMDQLVYDGIINKTSELYEAREGNEELNQIYKKRLVYQNTTFESVNPFNYAYGITIHKSQGSEYDNVLLYDENYMHNRLRSLYTGITRAKEVLVIIKTW